MSSEENLNLFILIDLSANGLRMSILIPVFNRHLQNVSDHNFKVTVFLELSNVSEVTRSYEYLNVFKLQAFFQ